MHWPQLSSSDHDRFQKQTPLYCCPLLFLPTAHTALLPSLSPWLPGLMGVTGDPESAPTARVSVSDCTLALRGIDCYDPMP